MRTEQKQIGAYRVLKSLGGGQAGMVYLVEDQEGGGKFALKLLSTSFSPTEREARRFRREFMTLTRLSHPNIVEVYESGIYREALYFVMEYVQGKTLSGRFLPADMPKAEEAAAHLSYLNQPKRIADLLQVMVQLCDALAWVHQKGIIHRDLKPDNMMLKAGDHLKLLDFGIAKRWGKQERTQVGSIMGTFTYISPEQAQCEDVDGRSDLYSLGVILYELLTGRPPFMSDEPIGRLYMHLNKAVPPLHEFNPHIAPPIQEIVLQLLQKDPMHRYQRAEDLREALTSVMEKLGYVDVSQPTVTLAIPELRIRDAALVGRHKERESLMGHLSGLRQGQGGGLVLLSGNSGIGKTRLAREIVASARVQQLECCTVRCHPESPPYTVYQEIMEQLKILLSMRQDDLPQTLWGDSGDIWFRMMQGAHPTSSSPDSLDTFSTGSGGGTESEKMLLFESCRAMLEAITAQEPLLFFLDDIMFADEISLELTEHLIRSFSSQGRPLLILGNFRNEDVGADHPLSRFLLRLAPERLVHIYDLKPLNAEEVKEMATSMLGLPPADKALAQLMRQSLGIPFFVQELLKAWDEEEQLMEGGDCWYLLANAFVGEETQTPGMLPATLKKRLLKRLDRLSDAARQVAAWLAVLGQESTFDLLFELCQMPETPFLGCLEELLQQKILLEDWSTGTESYGFSHPEIQRELYEQLDEDQKLLSHQKVAYTLKHSNATEGRFEVLAHHFLKANEREQGAWYLLLAAEQQLRALAYHSAWELVVQCHNLLQEFQEDVLFQAGSSWWLRVYQVNLELLENTGQYREGIDIANQVLAAIPPDNKKTTIHRWLATFHRHTGNYREAMECIQKALADAGDDEELRPNILQEAGRIYRAQGKHGAALEAFREALAWAISKHQGREEGRLCRMIGRVLHQRGELEEAKAHYTRAHNLAEETNDQRGSIAALCRLAALDLDLGELGESLELVQRASEMAEHAKDRRMLGTALAVSGQHLLLRRKLDEAEAEFRKAMELAVELGDQRMEGELMGWLGIVYSESDQNKTARLYLEEGLDKTLQVGDRLVELWMRCHLAIVDLHQHSRSHQEISDELDRILRITEQIEVIEVVLLARLTLGRMQRILGRYSEALDHFAAGRCLALQIGHRRTLAFIEREKFLLRRTSNAKRNLYPSP